MITRVWLVINSKGSVRVSKKPPKINGNEISIGLNLNIPNAIFERPRLVANVTIPDELVKEEILSTTVIDNIKEQIIQSTGLDFNVTVVKQME